MTIIYQHLNLSLFFVILCYACSPKVTRIDNNQDINLSGRWNATDSRQTGQVIAEQILGEAWLSRYQELHNNARPTVICGYIQNKSHEHIDAETFRKDIERAMINSGKVRLIQDAEKRQQIREERSEQQKYASQATQKKLAEEIGADFMLQGNINSIIDQNNKAKLIYYQINLTLTHLESNEVVWIGEKKITKQIRR